MWPFLRLGFGSGKIKVGKLLYCTYLDCVGDGSLHQYYQFNLAFAQQSHLGVEVEDG
jgi:hypothetical protein